MSTSRSRPADLEMLTPGGDGTPRPRMSRGLQPGPAGWNANLPTVKTHQLAPAFDVIDQVMPSSRRDADRLRGSVVVDAAPGLGKTTIATRYARAFHRHTMRRNPARTTSGHQRLPVAFRATQWRCAALRVPG